MRQQLTFLNGNIFLPVMAACFFLLTSCKGGDPSEPMEECLRNYIRQQDGEHKNKLDSLNDVVARSRDQVTINITLINAITDSLGRTHSQISLDSLNEETRQWVRAHDSQLRRLEAADSRLRAAEQAISFAERKLSELTSWNPQIYLIRHLEDCQAEAETASGGKLTQEQMTEFIRRIHAGELDPH